MDNTVAVAAAIAAVAAVNVVPVRAAAVETVDRSARVRRGQVAVAAAAVRRNRALFFLL